MDDPQNRRFRTMLVLLIALLIVVPLLMALSMGLFAPELRHDWGMMGDWMFDWGWLMMIPVAAIIVVVLVVVLSAGRESHDHMHQFHQQYYGPYHQPLQGAEGDPLAILDRRLASGSITIDEYNQIKERLAQH